MKHDSQELQDYLRGWLDGAAGRQMLKPIGNTADYLSGYGNGTIARERAMDAARVRYDEPLLSKTDILETERQ